MKKVLSVLMILGLVIGMAACGNKKAEQEAEAQRIQDSIENAEAEAAALAEAEAAAAEAEALAAAEAEAAALAEAEAAKAAPAKKTTVQKAKEVVKEVKDETPTKKRGGGESR